MEIYSVDIVEKNLVPKSQTKPFYIGTKEAPSALGDFHLSVVSPLWFDNMALTNFYVCSK